MNHLLWDRRREALMPFTLTRPVADLRVGILTLREKWERHLAAPVSTLTAAYLAGKYPAVWRRANTLIDASVLPDAALAAAVRNLSPGEALWDSDDLIAACLERRNVPYPVDEKAIAKLDRKTWRRTVRRLRHVWNLFQENDAEIRADFILLTAGRKSAPLPKSNRVRQRNQVFLEEGARVEDAVLNAATGPIYVGRNAEIMEGCLVRGPVALGDRAVLKMGAKIYGATTVGPWCKAGGEINNSILSAYSNKAHDGFLGNAVVGQWCNLGADTNNSNLKNNYGEVSVWSYEKGDFENTGLQFCGVFLGDHCKTGINTMLNTGTVAGAWVNLFGAGFPPRFIPSFSWGGPGGFSEYELDKALEAARAMYARRGMKFDQREQRIFRHLRKQAGV